MYFEFRLRRAHSRSRVERMYWSGVSLNSLTTCSKEVTVGTTGPIGSGLPQFGLPRRFAMYDLPSAIESDDRKIRRPWYRPAREVTNFIIIGIFSMKIKRKIPPTPA